MNNQKRYLSEVLSLDSWHDPIRTETGSAVHVEVSFQRGRLGGDDADFPFTFNIALRKALLTIDLESPLSIDRRTIARSIPPNQGELTQILDAQKKSKNNASLKGKLSPSSMHISASGGASFESGVSQEQKLKLVQQIPKTVAIPKPGGSQSYSWELFPGYEEYLSGQPWHPVDEPRFYTVSAKGKSKLSPSIKITMSCLLEDIIIDNLEMKDCRPLAIIKEMALNKVNNAAAVQYIKQCMKSMQLEAGALDDRFSKLIIADVISTES